ncbi:MAG: hypothetical protein KGS72_19510 [Cyanobacteria bacterium REEB67]|nr:hypothetical protein [Cyanobacteria bacterium REEB67]
MTKKQGFQYLWAFVVTWLGLNFIFPHIPGIEFTGSLGDAFGLAIIQTLITITAIFVTVIVALIAGLVYVIRKGDFDTKMSKSTITAWIAKQGFWKITGIATLCSVIINVFTWKLAASMSSTLTIDGWLPILFGAAIESAICFVPKYLMRPGDFSEKHFQEEIAATLAKELAEEANEHKNDETK